MAGAWLVDGYNVVFQRSKLGQGCPPHRLRKARESLLDLLTRFREATGSDITVVFDGALDPLGFTEDRTFAGTLEIVWSPQGKTADETIRSLLDRRKEKPTLVTSDRELAASARARGSPVLAVDGFLELAADETGGEPPADAKGRKQQPDDPDVRAKRDGISREEAEGWMKQFGLDDEVKL